jgi:ribosomal protein S18 acetylase RimI-like enzyme
MTDFFITEWKCENERQDDDLEMLAEMLHASVHAGASISFIYPFPLEEARAFWRDAVFPEVRKGKRRMLVARAEGRICGTVQLVPATPPNQRHRADVIKLMVHPRARRCGIARALMNAVEEVARAEGRTLLTLDTRTGDSGEPLYRSLGYVTVGVIPRYSRAADSPALEAASFLYKELA